MNDIARKIPVEVQYMYCDRPVANMKVYTRKYPPAVQIEMPAILFEDYPTNSQDRALRKDASKIYQVVQDQRKREQVLLLVIKGQ